MSIIIKSNNIHKANYCCMCDFAFRIDNSHCACNFNPAEIPVENGNAIPDYCPIEEYSPKGGD